MGIDYFSLEDVMEGKVFLARTKFSPKDKILDGALLGTTGVEDETVWMTGVIKDHRSNGYPADFSQSELAIGYAKGYYEEVHISQLEAWAEQNNHTLDTWSHDVYRLAANNPITNESSIATMGGIYLVDQFHDTDLLCYTPATPDSVYEELGLTVSVGRDGDLMELAIENPENVYEMLRCFGEDSVEKINWPGTAQLITYGEAVEVYSNETGNGIHLLAHGGAANPLQSTGFIKFRRKKFEGN